MKQTTNYRIDNLQYCNWSREIFQINNEAKLDAVHVTIAYHEDFDEVKKNVETWKKHFQEYKNGLVESVHKMGARFMQLTYNNQSLLATGCYEKTDSGVTRMGKEVIKEMNRIGVVIDMSHSAEKSTLDAIELSTKPIAITHANPSFWFAAKRNKSNEVLKELAKSGGMLGLSLYPHHLKDTSDCTLESFCEMAAQTAELMGIKHIGVGSDLCLKQPNSVVEWMRNGTWTKTKDYGEGSSSNPHFPKQPNWFEDARGFNNLEKGLKNVGFQETEVNDILGNNWYNFYRGMNN